MTASAREPVVLWGKSFCSWIGILHELKLWPVAVILTSLDHIALVRGSVSEDCFIGLEADVNESIVESLRGVCRLGLVDGLITSNTCSFGGRLDLKGIVGTEPLRRAIPGWCHDTWRLFHCEQGGVTTRQTTGVCLVPGSTPPPLADLEESVPRDASTVLCPRAPAHKYRPAPTCSVVLPLGSENLGTAAKPYFHGGGLLPGDLDRRTEVLTPGVYARKGDWALRSLTLEEVVVAKDFGKVLSEMLALGTVTNSMLRGLTPGKTLVALAGRWGCNGGGHFFKMGRKRGENDHDYPHKLPKFGSESEAIGSGEEAIKSDLEGSPEKTILGAGAAVPCKSPRTNQRFVLEETGLEECKRGSKSDHNGIPEDTTLGAGAEVPSKSPKVNLSVVFVETILKGEKEEADANGYRQDESTLHAGAEVLRKTSKVEIAPILIETVSDSEEEEEADEPKGKTVETSIQDTLDDIARENRDRKAVKSDDAVVPEYLWEAHLLEGLKEQYIHEGLQEPNLDSVTVARIRNLSNWLRGKFLQWWKRRVTTSYIRWAKEKYFLADMEDDTDWVRQDDTSRFVWSHASYTWTKEGKASYRAWWKRRFLITHKDFEPARDAIDRAARSSWWGWDAGSRPFHWRWPHFYQDVIRDGLKVHFQSTPPKYRKGQRDMSDEAMKLQVIKKLLKARERGYIAPGMIESLTAFFAVPKGDDDIRLVYDGSVSGLNLSIWVPRFFLPTLKTHLRAVDENTYMADVDIGEMFLNFILHRELRTLAGVDLTHYFPSDVKDTPDGRATKVWECWQRAAMGLTSSPYQACQAMGVAEEVIRGDRSDPKNVFRWDKVVLNLPGSDKYEPSKPWIYKVRSEDGRIAADIFIFVDDLRPTGPTRKDAWLAARQAASKLNHLGIESPRDPRRPEETKG